MSDRVRVIRNMQRTAGKFGAWRDVPLELSRALPGVAGIALGGCVAEGGDLWGDRAPCGFDDGELAHAHHPEGRPLRGGAIAGCATADGWICFRSRQPSSIAGGDRPTTALLHEYAHVLAGKEGERDEHGGPWRRAMAELGEVVPPRYLRGRCASCPHRLSRHPRRSAILAAALGRCGWLLGDCPCPGYVSLYAEHYRAAPLGARP